MVGTCRTVGCLLVLAHATRHVYCPKRGRKGLMCKLDKGHKAPCEWF